MSDRPVLIQIQTDVHEYLFVLHGDKLKINEYQTSHKNDRSRNSHDTTPSKQYHDKNKKAKFEYEPHHKAIKTWRRK